MDYKAMTRALLVQSDELEKEIERLENELANTRRELSQERAHVAIILGDLAARNLVVVPNGDDERGYECPQPGCYTHIDYPFEQQYCASCGVKFDWRTQDDYWGCDETSVDALLEKRCGYAD